MPTDRAARWSCPQCGYVLPDNDDLPPALPLRPWHVRDRAAVFDYVRSLGQETHEWLLALYVDPALNLLAVDTIARGTVTDCEVNLWRILSRAHDLAAAGFLLVHNHPSGDPSPSQSDIRATNRLRRISAELDVPLLDHLIIAGDRIETVGGI